MFFYQQNKRGQVTIFIILAILIIIAVAFIFFINPSTQTTTPDAINNPSLFLETCMKEDIANVVENISLHGGTLNPTNYVLFENQNVEYLCYTEEPYITCTVQRPLLKQHIEQEIEQALQSSAQSCIQSLKENFEDQGYTVNMQGSGIDVSLLLKTVNTKFLTNITLTKENSQEYKELSVVLNNNLYELVSVATNILEWEATYGDAETTFYMDADANLKVEKRRFTDGTRVYILTNRETGKKFQFATKNLIWPPGF